MYHIIFLIFLILHELQVLALNKFELEVFSHYILVWSCLDLFTSPNIIG